MKIILRSGIKERGGEGSGNFGHSGRPGKIGGSGGSGGSTSENKSLPTSNQTFKQDVFPLLQSGRILKDAPAGSPSYATFGGNSSLKLFFPGITKEDQSKEAENLAISWAKKYDLPVESISVNYNDYSVNPASRVEVSIKLPEDVYSKIKTDSHADWASKNPEAAKRLETSNKQKPVIPDYYKGY